MFGLTKREQRWKAEQQAAEVLAGLAAAAFKSVADVRIAEANAATDELIRLRAEVERLKEHAVTLANSERYAERERCAKIAESCIIEGETGAYNNACRNVAILIRGNA